MRKLVITPTYNECDNIAKLIEAVMAVPGDFEMLVVDDNSPDGTADIVAQYADANPKVHIMRRTGKRGFGPSYVDGFRYAVSNGYDAVFTMDADFSHDPASLPDLADALETHDFAIGSRYCGGKVSVVNWPIHRLIMSICAGAYVRIITGVDVRDPTSGFRGMRAKVLETIDIDTIKSNGYSFLVEITYRVKRSGFDIIETPIVFTERREGQSKMSRRIILEAVLMPWRLRYSRFKPLELE